MKFIGSYYEFDFEKLEESLSEMKELQEKIKQNKVVI